MLWTWNQWGGRWSRDHRALLVADGTAAADSGILSTHSMQGMESSQDFPNVSAPKELLGILVKHATLGLTLRVSD